MQALIGNTQSFRLAVAGRDASAAAITQGVTVASGLFAAERAAPAETRAGRSPWRVALVSAFLHLAVLALFLLRFAAAPSSPERVGVEEGMPENVNVSVITEADLRNLSMDPRKETPSQPSVPTNPSPPSPDASQEEAAAPPPKPAAHPRSQELSDFATRASEEFSAAVTQAFNAQAARQKAARPAVQTSNLKLYNPAASHSGKSNEFVRAVAWALAATKPMGNGKWGISAVNFSISASGQLQNLRLIHSSGDNWLDTGALMAVRQAHFPVPPAGLSEDDRTFNVEYISQ
jgi:periplasmic protein TonB